MQNEEKREITIEDVQLHRRRVERNEEIVRLAMSEFGVHEQELQEGFVKQYATRAARLKRIDEEYRKIKIVEVDEENQLSFGPEYVLAETYDEMIEYLKARQTIVELLDQFDIKTASYFESIDDLDAISKEDAFQMILDIIPKLICDIEELVAQIEEIDKKQLFTTVLIAALNNIIAKMKEVPQLLQEEKEKYEIELQRQKELSKRNIETFRKCVDSRGMHQSKFFHIFDKEINPELMRKIQQDFECRNDERLLMMCCCETGFKTEFVMTNENLHISDKYRTRCWKLESIDVVSIIKSERKISLYLEGKEHQQDSFEIEENQLEDINMFVYQFNYFLREINGNEISENRLDCIDMEMLLMDSAFRDLVKTSKHCIVGQPYITATNMDNFMIAKKCIGIPDTVKTYMIYDTTTFGSWNNGIAFCEDGIYYNIDSDQGKMSWDNFSRARIKKGLAFVSIYIGNLRIQTDCTEDSKILIQTVEKWQKIILSYPRQFGIKIEIQNQDSCTITKNNAQNQSPKLEVSNDMIHNPDLVERNVNDEMFCTHCGKKIKRTTKFCNYCGNKVNYHNKECSKV